MTQLNTRSFADIRQALLAHEELALVDVREEAPFAEAHPLFAANIPLSKLELEVLSRIPRLDTAVTVYDNGEGLAQRAVERLQALGYSDVKLLEGGLQGWREAGGELFIDVNVPSKAFGELVEHHRHTPSLAAEEVLQLLESKADVVVLDARRYDEYQTMSIPSGISVPGAELVLRARELAPDPNTRIIVNCAGRTRSIIGTQSLVNAGIPNQVSALRNGTIGWLLAGQTLDHGQARRFAVVSDDTREVAGADARRVADKAGVRRASRAELSNWQADPSRTTYLLDVRTPEEFAKGHLPHARSTPGGQLVQETDHYASVRGARLVLVDDDGVRANMSASWLAQLGWEVFVVDYLQASDFSEQGDWNAPIPAPLQVEEISPHTLAEWQRHGDVAVLDFTASANYVKRHIPGAWWTLRAQLQDALHKIPKTERYVLTCGSSKLARLAVPEVEALTGKQVFLLKDGTASWIKAGLPLETGESQLASPRIDRYRRPYEGTDAPREAMQAYLDWEFGLVDQLARDGTHGFHVI
ncbi:rhodanese homology domain-containing protein [Pseudomonas sp. CDFA 553]|uniref:rhodanese homology domain-containing protein n=1 Tax=Pseudomonas quasicaspiana TaxID=2829821 RepID=UPI001E525AEC|nr:rhodanese homology domain-containing protein [Pseudomonas quasicaspiana]MCD5987088.1 rhodanese homology domain-containing protein [Pseudomonas quasicaspiana]